MSTRPSDKTMLILYYSGSGNTENMAKAISNGLRSSYVGVEIKRVGEFEVKHLSNYDGLVLGSPTYFSNVAWQVKKLIDASIMHYRDNKQLSDKVAGIFTSSGTKRDAKDCLKMLEVALGFHHGMRVIPGIIRVDSEDDGKVRKRCHEYGQKLAEELKNPN